MRSVLLGLAFALIACSSEPSPSPPADAAPDLCVCTDAGLPADAPLEVGPDASAPDASGDVVDAAPPEDRASVTDATADAPPPDASRCPMGVTGTCGGMRVNLQSGVRQPDGTTIHCGACDVSCAAGMFCLGCVCER